MFSSIGWVEIAVVLLLGIIIIGPERLPAVIMDVRAAIYAARKAINNAKAELNGEIGGLGAEFEQLRGPISQAAEWGKLGPRGAITKALFDGDDSAWDDFDPRKVVGDLGKPNLLGEPAGQATAVGQPHGQAQGHSQGQPPQPAAGGATPHSSQSANSAAGFDYSQIYSEPVRPPEAPHRAQQPGPSEARADTQQPPSKDGGRWEDVT